MSDDMVMVTISKKAASKQIKRKAKTFAVPETTNIVSVIGSDTYLGAHMVKHLSAYAKTVYGFSQEKDFNFSAKPIAEHGGTGLAFPPHPILSDWLFVCIEPRIGFQKYTSRIWKLYEYLSKQRFHGELCLFSSLEICRDELISTESPIDPCSEEAVCLATAENILRMMQYQVGNEVFPHIIRVGDVYGDEIGLNNTPGIINGFVHEAETNHSISDLGIASRTFTHISDVCDLTVKLMSTGFCPDIVVIPGENMTIREAAEMIAEKYDVPVYHKINSLVDIITAENERAELKFTLKSWVKERVLV